jgi:hypothetical protein
MGRALAGSRVNRGQSSAAAIAATARSGRPASISSSLAAAIGSRRFFPAGGRTTPLTTAAGLGRGQSAAGQGRQRASRAPFSKVN